MGTFTFENKEYMVDTEGFLLNSNDWDENFARGMAPKLGILSGLSEDHWKIINFIRNFFKRTGRRPVVYVTCRKNQLDLQELNKLFPTGYLRGACKIAGVAVRGREVRTYEVDDRGFLINPEQWHQKYAILKARELQIRKLTNQHWQVINFLSTSFEKNHIVPTIYDTCEATGIGLEEFQKLFPEGYHRSAVKISGLRTR